MKRIISAVAALALTLAMVGPAMAATTSATTTVTASVPNVLSMTGVPASIAFGVVVPGVASDYPTFNIGIVSNGAAFTVTASSAGMSGPVNYPNATRLSDNAIGTSNDTIPGGNGSLTSIPTVVGVLFPSNAPAGDYTGTITFTATTH